MPQQNVKCEQISASLQMVMDYDLPITLKSEYLRVFRKALGPGVEVIKYKKNNVYVYKNNNITNYFLAASITYLGNPHPLFKKRMQLKKWYKEFYNEYKEKENVNINVVGVYHYDDMEIYCLFNVDDYINNKLNSSSAHVYTNDLYQAVKNGTFEKIDINNNHITVVKGIYLKDYFDGKVSSKNPIFNLFEKFNSEFKFDEWLRADHCIQEMMDNNWYQYKGTEWPGWFLEFRVDEFIKEQNCEHIMMYTGNKNKVEGMLDFDLFFGLMNFYGDLKASDIKKKEAPGNDQINTLEAINRYGRLWYVLFEHETIKDITRNSEMAIARMKLVEPTYVDGDHIVYQSKFKHSVKFKKMYIFELNTVNMHEILKDFNQGHNSGSTMAARAAKFLLKKNNMNNSIIFSYEV